MFSGNLFFIWDLPKIDESYKLPLSLEPILIYIRNSNYLSEQVDTSLNEKIKGRLQEIRLISSFEKLTESQINNFENIKKNKKKDLIKYPFSCFLHLKRLAV